MYARLAKPFNIDPALIAPIPGLPRLEGELLASLGAKMKPRHPNACLADKLLGRQFGTINLVHTAHRAEHFLRRMPKAELHLHSGAMNDIFTIAERAWELSAHTDGLLQKKYNSRERLIQHYLDIPHGDLAAYLENYDELPRYIARDLTAIRDMSYAAAMNHAQNGVKILEIRKSIKSGQFADKRYSDYMADVNFGPYEELCAMLDGFVTAEKDTAGAIKTFLTICFRRSDSHEQASLALDEVLILRERLADRYGYTAIVGVDIMGLEYLNKAKKFKDVFRRARACGLHVTAHAGEGNSLNGDWRVPGEGSILDALNSGAERIGHGTALYFPTPLLAREQRWISKEGLRKNAFIASLIFGTAYEFCPSSNVATGAPVTLGYHPRQKGLKPRAKTHPLENIGQYPFEMIMALGGLNYTDRDLVLPIPCADGNHTLNADIANQYGLVAHNFDLGMDLLLALSRYSIRRSFAPPEVKAWATRAWRDFAEMYLVDPNYSSPDEQVKAALCEYQRGLQNKLAIPPSMIELIIQEVHQPAAYLDEYLLERFHAYNKYPTKTLD